MRLAVVAVAALLLAAPADAARYSTSSGLSVEVPAGWVVLHEHRLALAGHGAYVHLVETVDYAHLSRFPPRPQRFAFRGRAQVQPCGPRARPGWRLRFRDGGRGFYAFVYLGTSGTRAEALRALDSLVVRARDSDG